MTRIVRGHRRRGSKHIEPPRRATPRRRQVAHRALADGDASRAARAAGVSLKDFARYDTAQFARIHGKTWSAETMTEIVALTLPGGEADTVAPALQKLRCGPRASLRPCAEDDVAVKQQLDCRLPAVDGYFAPRSDAGAGPAARAILDASHCDLGRRGPRRARGPAPRGGRSLRGARGDRPRVETT